jgi:hypothetical protein
MRERKIAWEPKVCVVGKFWTLVYMVLICRELKTNFGTHVAVIKTSLYHTIGFVSLFVCLMVFNATFNNISVISWRSVLLVGETGGPAENHWPVASHWQTLSHSVVHLFLIEIVNPTTIRSWQSDHL